MATLLDEAINAGQKDTTKMPKFLPLSTAKQIETVSAVKKRVPTPEYKNNFAERMAAGVAYGVAQMADIAPSLELLGEETKLGIGGYFGAKEAYLERKALNIATLQRNLAAAQQNRLKDVGADTANSTAFKLGAAVPNLAMMMLPAGGAMKGAQLLGAGAKTAAAIGAGAGIAAAIPFENTEQQSDRIKFDENGNVDTSNITPEWARKTVGGTAFYMVGMGILETKFGIFKTLSQWEKPIPFKVNFLKNLSVPITTLVKTGINEGATEGLQSLWSSGIQLAEGNITLADLPDRIKQAWEDTVIGFLLGGAVGSAVAVNQAHNVKTMLNEEVSKVVTDPEECEQIVNAIYDSGTAEMANVISKELELSSELNTKHGAIYDTMQGAIYDAINNAGAFEGISETEIAQYVSDTSKMFANQVLAEANKRGVLIDDVLKSSDIKFENGKIKLQAGKDIVAEIPIVQEEVSKNRYSQPPKEVSELIQFNANELLTDAKTFQYKEGGDESGVTEKLKDVRKWSPLSSGKVIVYETKDGKRYIADGHQRLGLAKRLINEGIEQNVKLDGYLYKEIDGYTPQEIRELAALKNIREGMGTAIDTAKAIRESGGIENIGDDISKNSEIFKQGIGLSYLTDENFNKVINEFIEPSYAAIVGNIIRENVEKQTIAIDTLIKNPPSNQTEATQVAQEILYSDTRTVEQINLFGTQVRVDSLAPTIGKLKAKAISELKSIKGATKNANKNIDILEKAKNKINVTGNEEMSELARIGAEILNKYTYFESSLSNKINQLAKDVLDDKITERKAVDEIKKTVMDADIINKVFKNSEGSNDKSRTLKGSKNVSETSRTTGVQRRNNQSSEVERGIQEKTGSKEEINPSDKLYQEARKLYQEIEEIDKTGTEYNEPTININGVERPTTNSEGKAIAKTKEAIEHFYKWFGDSKVVDEEGKPLVVYHGSVNTFEIFDKGKASPEGDMGAGFYFTSNEEDADSNYHGGGPDFDNKVARRAEQIQQEKEEEGEDIDYEEAKKLAEKELKGEPMQFSVYLKIENPCNTDSLLFTDIEDNIDINEEDFETEDEYYEERDYQLQNEIDNVLEYAEREFGGVLASYNYDEQRQNIFNIITDAIYNGGINVTGLKQSLNELYLEDENGNMVANEVLRAIIQSLGYDGIIDDSVAQKFNMNIPADTTHYIAFEPNQIKSVENQGTFDENNPNIYYQIKDNPKDPNEPHRGYYNVSQKAITLLKDADFSTLPHEFAHFWLDNMWRFYNSGKASEAYKNNFKGVLDWLNVKDWQTEFTKPQHEKFARGYEKYLYNGYAPNGLIQGAFDNYDKWLQKVYNDASELKVKLNADAIAFFDSMTTGELLDYEIPETQAEIREKNIEQMNKDIETARKFVVEKQAEYNNFDGGNVITKDTVPVTTEGEKKQSKAYTNQASILGIAEELDYNQANIAEQNKLATDFVKNNLDEARQVVNGQKEAPSNILKNAIYNAYLKEMLAIGDNEAYVNALKNQSLELTRAGQEIASQRGAIENIFDSGYWIRRIENLKKTKLANQKFGNGVTASEQEQALSKMNDFIKNKVEAVMAEFMDATPEQQKKIAEKLSKDIAAEFKVKPQSDILYQSMREPSEVRTRTNAYNYIYKYINSALGLDLTKAQYNEIIAKTQAIQKSIEATRNRNGNPSALFFKNISEMENYANSIEPSPALAILTSTVGRGNMLFSPKTIALNIESNIVNFFTEAITRRIQNGAINMAVDPQAIKDYLAYSREVFNTSGYQVSSMPTLDPTTQILSEKMTTTAGNRVVDKLGRFFEQTIFKYGLGAPDLFFKDMTFVDTANILATKEAKGDSKKATELFKDICLIEPKTAKGKELREIAINEALIATYQNKGKTSDLALGIRNAINKASGSANLGDMLSPFVKTPANVIGLGFDYSMGGLVALKNIQTIYNDIQSGTFTETTRKSLRSLARNGIGFVAAMLIAGMIDDDDYIPEYALLDAKERELVKMKGGVFNSVKIGDKYISLDYFGPLAMPLVSYLNSRRGNDAKNKVWNYFQGTAYQALKLPVIGDIKNLLEGTGRTLTKDVETNIKLAEDAAIDFVSSRSIPAIVTDLAKMTDEYERETSNNAINRLKSKLPVLRQELPAQYNYGTGAPRETQNPISQLFAGARIKEEVSNPIINEFDRLQKANTEEKVNIAKVTKSGKLSTLSDEKKIEAEVKFAQRYAANVGELIQTYDYNNADDNQKAKAINKVRENIREDLKVEYGLKEPPKPKTRTRRRRRRRR